MTPGGLLAAGDILTHKDIPGMEFVVVSRNDNSLPYTVWIRRKDKKRIWRTEGNEGTYFVDASRLSDDLTQARMLIEVDARDLGKYGGWRVKT